MSTNQETPRNEQIEAALGAMWAFASGMVFKHGSDGDNTMTDAEHEAWQDAAGASNHALNMPRRDDGLTRIDAEFDKLNTLLDASGSLEAEATMKAIYELRLAIVTALGDNERIQAAQAMLAEIVNESNQSNVMEP